MNLCTAHIAADIAATVDGTHITVHDFHPSAVVHITLLATAIEVVDQDVRAVHLHMGAIVESKRTEASSKGDRGIFCCQHVAHVAATVDGAYASRSQGKGGHTFHGCLVVATEESTYIINTRTVP